jgi:hypothetical protein
MPDSLHPAIGRRIVDPRQQGVSGLMTGCGREGSMAPPQSFSCRPLLPFRLFACHRAPAPTSTHNAAHSFALLLLLRRMTPAFSP